ncbi:MAG: thioredoxin domain-containing protein [Betaproteobacteria bacterium HGW-Betaproteobacteria-11]|nr:MAG: thioredoxin domain-containing protein [Betaproteobacteria bacterium HGW-Betaproteobacteria-11]
MPTVPAALHSNRLAQSTSPYLLQHAGNPVAWQPWDAEALAAARRENRPILLSIGYSACHWCHVMAHESFEDEGVATVMNRLFINIKVDREERPDLDQIYQTAHQLLTGRPGGWPLTLCLTPDGMPFFAGTYFPKTPRHGLPAFADLCESLAAAFHARRAEVESQNNELRRALAATLPGLPARGEFDRQPLAQAVAAFAHSFDAQFGGFGGAPKFPHAPDLRFLLASEDDSVRAMALTTLTQMAEAGLYDQVGGGFCRYSVDQRWEIPHFEKMLYDNGLLLGLYAEAWRLTGDALYARVVAETASWLGNEMQAASGGFYSALDADAEGEEGRYYVWRRDELRALLTDEEWRVAAPHWGLDQPPNFEGRWHLKLARPLVESERPLLDAARQTLYAARQQRVRPGCDDKILTSWNALAIEGLARAARLFGRPDWLARARAALAFLRDRHWRDGRLFATSRDGRVQHPAYLDDHAFLLAALLEMMQAEFQAQDLVFATTLADTLLARFEDSAGGFFFTAHDHEALIQRPKSGHDNATPAGNGIAALALQRLGHILGDPRYLAAAERTLRLFWPQINRSAAGFSSLLLTLEEALTPPNSVILRGPEGEVHRWQRELIRVADAHCTILALPNGTRDLPAALNKPESAAANAWVCRGVTCHAAVTRFDDVLPLLEVTHSPPARHEAGVG